MYTMLVDNNYISATSVCYLCSGLVTSQVSCLQSNFRIASLEVLIDNLYLNSYSRHKSYTATVQLKIILTQNQL